MSRRDLRIANALVILLFVTTTWVVALYYAWTCGGDVHENNGRELKESRNTRRLLAPEPVCSLVQTAVLKNSNDDWEDPWTETEWINAIDGIAQNAQGAFKMCKDMQTVWDPPCDVSGKCPFSSYHSAERLWTLNHPNESNKLPYQHPESLMKKLCYEYALPHGHDLDSMVHDVDAALGDNVDTPVTWEKATAVHYADLHNAIRHFQGRPALPFTKEYIIQHWIPYMDKYFQIAQERTGGIDGLTFTVGAHAGLAQAEVERIRASR